MPDESVGATPGVPGQSATDGNVSQNPSAEPKPAPEAPKPQDFFEVKINGQQRRFSREEAMAKLALAEGANQKFESASQKEKKYNDWKATAQKDAMKALMDPELGLSKDQIRTRFESWYKENFIDPETMTESEKEAKRLREENDDWKRKDEEQKTLKQQETERAELEKVSQSIQAEIIDMLETSGLPKTRFFGNRLAFYMNQNLSKGYDAPKEVLVQQVKDEGVGIINSLVEGASGEQLATLFPDMIKKIRMFDTEQLKARLGQRQSQAVSSPGMPNSSNRNPNAGNKSMRDVDNYLNSLRRTKR